MEVNPYMDAHNAALIDKRRYDDSWRETSAGYTVKRVFTSLGFALGSILTLGILGLVFHFINRHKIEILKSGRGSTSLVQAQLRLLKTHDGSSKIETIRQRQQFFADSAATSAYQKKSDDPAKIEGSAFSEKGHAYYFQGSSGGFDAEAHPELYTKNGSPESLLHSAFAHQFEEMVNDEEIAFSRNEVIRKREEYAPQRSALIKLMVMDLIEQAKLETAPCGTVDLHLNNCVKVFNKASEEVLARGEDGSLEIKEIYPEQDVFTPLNRSKIKGIIDPVGVKWIHHRLDVKGKKDLRRLLLASFYGKDSVELQSAMASFKKNKDLQYAAKMIEKIAAGVEERHANLFTNLWMGLAKEEEGVLPPVSKRTPLASSSFTASKKSIVPISDAKVKSTALSVLKAAGHIFLHLSTLGIYGLVRFILDQNAIHRLDPTTLTQMHQEQRALYAKIDALEAEKKNIGVITQENPLKTYQKKNSDKDEIVYNPPDDEEELEQYAWRLSVPGSVRNTTMESLLHHAFDQQYNRLIEKAEVWKQIKFSRNYELAYAFEQYSPNFLSLIVKDLVDCASLTKKDDEYRLHLNDALYVGRSESQNIVRVDNGRELREPIYYDNDDWTPLGVRDDTYPDPVTRGIDPIGLKWILEDLTKEEKAHLDMLLLDRFIPEDDDDYIDSKAALAEAKAFVKKNNARAQLVLKALNMTQEIGKSLAHRYKSLMEALWIKNANADDGPLPPNKGVDEFVPPPRLNTYEEWEPAVNLNGNFAEIFNNMQARTTTIWDELSREYLASPISEDRSGSTYNLRGNSDDAHNHLKGIYHSGHSMVGGGCLYGAFTLLTTQNRNEVSDANLKEIKRAMADYAENNKGEYRDQMRKELGMSIDQYIGWLRGTTYRNDYSYSNIEVQIYAHTFGIKVQVFGPGSRVRVDDSGLLQSDGFCYGPNTKESLYLYCTNGTWYALQPKLKAPKASDNSKMAKAVREYNAFWSRINSLW